MKYLKNYQLFEYKDDKNTFKFIPFNYNEIKYIKAKSENVIYQQDNYYIVDSFSFRKLKSGDYLVGGEAVCTTLQTAFRYIKDKYNEVSKYLINVISNKEISNVEDKTYWYEYDDNAPFLALYDEYNLMGLNYRGYFQSLCEKFHIDKESMLNIFRYIINTVLYNQFNKIFKIDYDQIYQ